MISRYSFGIMEIDGTIYRKDLMILPGGAIHHPWWRAAGHVLTAADIAPILAAAPASLVVGTGDPGLMRPDAGLLPALEARGIATTVLPTARAMAVFNRLSERGDTCAGCFHLTC